jgi:hypothetical protein
VTQSYILMADGKLHNQISRLEIEIEELAKAIEKCRKIIAISKAAIVVGTAWMLALVLGVFSFAPISIIGAISTVIFGIVSFGSNVSTSKQNMASMKEAEALRAELINRIDPRVVRDGARQR